MTTELQTQNVELKDVLDVIFEAVNMEGDAVSGSYFSLFKNLISLFESGYSVVKNFTDFKAEILNLKSAASRADLEAYVSQKFQQMDNDAVRVILELGLKVAEDMGTIFDDIIALKAKI